MNSQVKAIKYSKCMFKFPWVYLRKYERKKVLNIINNLNLSISLDLGSGPGFFTKLLFDNGSANIYALDKSQEMLNQINFPCVKIYQPAEIPFGEKKFKFILCFGLIEFTKNYSIIIKNCKRALDINGLLLITIPYKNPFYLLYFLYHYFITKKPLYYHATKEFERVLSSNKLIIQKKMSILPFNIIYLVKN